MVISIESISQKQGGDGGISHNDYEDIINEFGGVTNVRSIKPKQAIIRSGDVIDSLQFFYNVVTEDGMSHEHTGNKCGGDGGEEQRVNFADDEQITEIGVNHDQSSINFLTFKTSKEASYFFGKGSPEGSSTLPAGVFFCSSSDSLNSLGTYEIVEVPQKIVTLPAKTITEISTINDVVTSVVTIDSSRNLAIGLGASGFGMAVLVAVGAFSWFWKIKRSRNI